MYHLFYNEFDLEWPTNGVFTDEGYQTGDPLSPYIFVLCMERLAHLISTKVQNMGWKPLQIAKNAPKISHLFFADDLVLFAKASLDQVVVIIGVLDTFYLSTSHYTSKDKSFLKTWISMWLSRLDRLLGLKLQLILENTSEFLLYMGVPQKAPIPSSWINVRSAAPRIIALASLLHVEQLLRSQYLALFLFTLCRQ